MVVNLLRILHSLLAGLIIFNMVQRKDISSLFMYGELGLTIFRGIVESDIKSVHFKTQIVLSLVLGYYIFPNKF